MFHQACAVCTHVATGEVSTLKHKVRNDAVELGAGVAKALLAGGKRAEVLYRLGHDIVEELKVDTALLCCTLVSKEASSETTAAEAMCVCSSRDRATHS